MSTLPLSARYAFPVYTDAADYLARTGRHAPWNPALPVRQWETLGQNLPSVIQVAKLTVGGTGLASYSGPNPSFVNLPCAPTMVPWTPPVVAVTMNGIPVGGDNFATLDETKALITRMNAGAKPGEPTIDPASITEFKGFPMFPYVYAAGELRRRYTFMDSKGLVYTAGTQIALENNFGSAVLEASFDAGGNPADIPTTYASWAYNQSTGAFAPVFRETVGIPGNPVVQPRAGAVGPAMALNPGETLIWTLFGGQMVNVPDAVAPVPAPTGTVTFSDSSMVQDTNARVRNIEKMLANVAGGAVLPG